MAARSTPDAALLAGLQERALETRAAGFGPQDLANTLWAFATLRLAADRKVLEALEERVLLTAHAFAPQHIANTLWALVSVAWECDVRCVCVCVCVCVVRQRTRIDSLRSKSIHSTQE